MREHWGVCCRGSRRRGREGEVLAEGKLSPPAPYIIHLDSHASRALQPSPPLRHIDPPSASNRNSLSPAIPPSLAKPRPSTCQTLLGCPRTRPSSGTSLVLLSWPCVPRDWGGLCQSIAAVVSTKWGQPIASEHSGSDAHTSTRSDLLTLAAALTSPALLPV